MQVLKKVISLFLSLFSEHITKIDWIGHHISVDINACDNSYVTKVDDKLHRSSTTQQLM